MNPPSIAAGKDDIANGNRSRHEKWPARKKRSETIADTKTLRTRAVGLIVAEGKPNKAITAM
jgi:hypothetical protein